MGGGGGTIVRRDWGRIWKKEGGNTYMIVNNYVRVCFILNRCKYSLTEKNGNSFLQFHCGYCLFEE